MQPRVPEEVRDDAILARLGGQPRRAPVVPGAGEVVEQLALVHGEHGVVRLWLGVDDSRARLGERRADAVRAAGQLGTGDPHADPDLAAGVVQPVPVAVDDRHGDRHGREPNHR